ncbi:glycoside hydrolase family 18 protein [Francisella sp. SYW-9]|uniref:glycoside hydrolase family 18 protein n=1 Tax=Francisella sp. SYW-9 TaxID=2610888 RepID=UPI00123D517E|nr:glycoside hydrolase family 18 protein [Francisella sp. SYW-9]
MKYIWLSLSFLIVSSATAAYDSNKISGFVINWGSGASILKEKPYSTLTSVSNIAFVTNIGASLYWGAPGGVALSIAKVKDYILQSGKPANKFMLSFGGSTNSKGWKYFNQSNANIKTIVDSLSNIVKQTGVVGIDVDVDVPNSSPVFKSNFQIFISDLSNNLRKQGKLISIDLPHTGACGASINSNNRMCLWLKNSSCSWGTARWFFSGNYRISQYIDYYNVMSYSWPKVGSKQALIYTKNSVLSYNKLGVPFSKLNIGIEVGEAEDKSNIDDRFINGVIAYANKKNLKGIFVWNYNVDYANSGTYSNLREGRNTTVVNALLAS